MKLKRERFYMYRKPLSSRISNFINLNNNNEMLL